MASEQTNTLKRQEQLIKWLDSETNKSPKLIKHPDKIKFSNEVQFLSACSGNDWEEIDRLLVMGIDINCTQSEGLTSLHQACIDDNEDLIKYLIGKGADINVQDNEGWTPLFAAVSCNYLPIIRLLLSHDARLDIVSYDGELCIDQTSNQVLISLIREEMKRRNLDPNEVKNRERNAMLSDIETMKETNDFSKFLLANNGGSLLHVAASKNYTDVLEQLLEIITPEMLNHTDKDGWNALHVAAHWGNKNACALLVDSDIDFDQLTFNNKTILEVSDDNAKPYIREEIRKARFRRQDRAALKRPAPSPVVDYVPSDTKIICTDKNSSLEEKIDTDSQASFVDNSVTISTDQVSESPPRDSTKPLTFTDVESESTKSVDSVAMELSTDKVATRASDEHSDKIPAIIMLDSVLAVSDKENIEVEDDVKCIENNETRASKVIATVLPITKVVESESQRKDKARHVRSTRRPTQGVSAEQIEEATKLMSKDGLCLPEKKAINGKSGDNHCNDLVFNSVQEEDKDIENKSIVKDTDLTDMDFCKGTPMKPISDRAINGDNHKTILTEQNSDPSEIIISAINSEFGEQTELKRKNGGYLANKRKARDRQPTGIVEPKDIRAAEMEFLKDNQSEKLPGEETDSVVDYKAMYEHELKEKAKLQRNLTRMRRDLEETVNKIKDLQENRVPPQEQPANCVMISSETDEATMERLREENQKMKDANSALIRVISRLSHPQSRPVHSNS